jgi:hypothetical protein
MCTDLQNTYKVEFPRMSDYEKLKMRHVKLDLNSIPAYDVVLDLNSIPAYDDEPGETQFQSIDVLNFFCISKITKHIYV